MNHIQQPNGATSAGSFFFTRLFVSYWESQITIVFVTGWVPFGAVVVVSRRRPEGCVAVGSDLLPRVLYVVAMVVC